LSYECRNGIKIGAGRNQNFVLDISSTSSEDEDVRLLKELKGNFLHVFLKKSQFSKLKSRERKEENEKSEEEGEKSSSRKTKRRSQTS
jgi:hypothetical protein